MSGGRHIRKNSKTYPKSNFGWYGPPITGVDTSENQEPPQTQLFDDIEVTPPEYISYIDLAINPTNKATTS